MMKHIPITRLVAHNEVRVDVQFETFVRQICVDISGTDY